MLRITFVILLSFYILNFPSPKLHAASQERLVQGIDHQVDHADMSSKNEQTFKEATRHFRHREYQQALNIIKDLRGDSETLKTKYYLKGLIYNRLDDFDLAINSLEKSLELGNTANDIAYEIGQAYYGKNELNKATQYFTQSYNQNHMRPTSLYYLGHIAQIYDQHRQAREFFTRLINEPQTDETLKQVAQLQRAESLLALARKDESQIKRRVEDFVLPEFEEILEQNPNPNIARDTQVRIDEIKREFGLDPTILVNNRQIPLRRWQVDFTQRFTYDNNITLSNDLPTTEATQRGSYILNSELMTNYTYVHNRKFLITPQLRINRTKHTDQSNSEVFQNDSYALRPALKTKWEYTLFNRPASLILDWEYDYIARDREAQKNIQFFANSNTFTLGQRFQLFRFGETTARIKKRSYNAFDEALDFETTTFSLDQVAQLPNRHLLIGLINFDQIDAQTETASTDTLTLRADYIIPRLIKNIDAGLNITYVRNDHYNDPSKESADVLVIPGLNLTRRIGKNIRTRASYEYLKSSSDNSLNEFTKHMVTFELRVIF